ncbi:MAG TPA: hypothetical protein VMW58_07190 [Anaerolineae bacterium]|nr:hypothetical protein [Anaerolineae bacterium]
MSGKSRATDSVLGVVVIGSVVTGVASLIAALFPFFSADFVGAGVLLIAAALSFGLLGVAVLGR